MKGCAYFWFFSNLIASKLLSSNRRMHNFIEKIHKKSNDICKKFAGNRVNEHGNVSRRGVIPTFSDLEVIALSLTAEAFGYDSENNLFKRLAESPEHIPNLISRRQFTSVANSRLVLQKTSAGILPRA